MMFDLYEIPRTTTPVFTTWSNTLVAQDKDFAVSEVKDALEGKKPFNTSFRIYSSSGEKYIRAIGQIKTDDMGKPIKLIGVNWDMTHVKKTDQRLMESKLGFWELDIVKQKITLSPAALKLLGFFSTDDLSFNLSDWLEKIHPEERVEYSHCLDRFMTNNSKKYEKEIRVMHVNGDYHWLLDSSTDVTFSSDGKLLKCRGILQDINQLKIKEKIAIHEANHDPLTKLPTKKLTNDRVAHTISLAKRKKKRFAVLFVDVDDLKRTNDEYGHAAGDCLIKKVASILSGSVRKSDTVGRIGGDEFLIIINDISSDKSVEIVLDGIFNELKKDFHINKNKIRISVSIGISIYPNDGDEPDVLIKHADQAMYHVKKNGKDGFHFYS